MKPSLLCFALFTLAFVECRTCRAEAEPARVRYDFRSGTGPARKCDAGADDVSGRGADHAAAQQPLPAMGHGTGINFNQPARVDAETKNIPTARPSDSPVPAGAYDGERPNRARNIPKNIPSTGGRVDAGQVCAVHRAISHRKQLSPATCATIAQALNDTPDPLLFAAIAVNESGMNPRAINVVRPGVYDLGLMQVRCVTLVVPAEEIGSSSAGTNGGPTSLIDDHLMTKGKYDNAAQRTGLWIAENQPIMIPRDRCTNGAARGLYAHQLLDPGVNIRTSAAVLASHGGSLTRYSGSTRERGYGARIAVLVAAWAGELRIPKRATGAKWARVKELARRIVEVLGKERRS